jgi:hypothetical protein
MKKYTIEFTVEDDGDDKESLHTKSTNKGFSPLELIGMLQMKIFDLQKQVWEEVSPCIERTVKIEE